MYLFVRPCAVGPTSRIPSLSSQSFDNSRTRTIPGGRKHVTRKPKEQDTLLLLTNRATHLRKYNGVADKSTRPHSLCVTVPNLVVLR